MKPYFLFLPFLFLPFLFCSIFFISSGEEIRLSEEKRNDYEREIYALMIQSTSLNDTIYEMIDQGKEATHYIIDYGLAAAHIPDSLLIKFVFEIEPDSKLMNKYINDSLELTTFYFSSTKSEKQSKIRFSRCGFSDDTNHAFLYFETWTPYYPFANTEVMSGGGAYVFLAKSDEKWGIANVNYIWSAN